MKKLILSLLTASLLFINCSKKDEAVPETPATNTVNTFTSSIKINDIGFEPSVSTELIPTITYINQINNNGTTTKGFILSKYNSISEFSGVETLQLTVVYPSNQAKIDGTYSLSNDYSQINLTKNATLGYTKDMSVYFSNTGSIKVTDLGGGKFKLEFININIKSSQNDKKIVTGNFEGTFKLLEEQI